MKLFESFLTWAFSKSTGELHANERLRLIGLFRLRRMGGMGGRAARGTVAAATTLTFLRWLFHENRLDAACHHHLCATQYDNAWRMTIPLSVMQKIAPAMIDHGHGRVCMPLTIKVDLSLVSDAFTDNAFLESTWHDLFQIFVDCESHGTLIKSLSRRHHCTLIFGMKLFESSLTWTLSNTRKPRLWFFGFLFRSRSNERRVIVGVNGVHHAR